MYEDDSNPGQKNLHEVQVCGSDGNTKCYARSYAIASAIGITTPFTVVSMPAIRGCKKEKTKDKVFHLVFGCASATVCRGLRAVLPARVTRVHIALRQLLTRLGLVSLLSSAQ